MLSSILEYPLAGQKTFKKVETNKDGEDGKKEPMVTGGPNKNTYEMDKFKEDQEEEILT